MVSLSPYEIFNYLEGGIWIVVAVALPFRFSFDSKPRKIGLLISAVGFVAFGVSDFLEATRQAAIPLWLWGLKVVSGIMILCGRYTYIGWRKFSVAFVPVFIFAALISERIAQSFDRRRSQGRIIVEQEGVPAKSDRSGG